MTIWYIRNRICLGERGAVAVFVAVTLVALIGFTALAVDVGYLYGVKNELHNAADAGALAGAHELFDDDGNLTVAAAIAEAERITPLNSTGKEAVAHLPIETGHWSFINKVFTPSGNTTQAEWQERSFSDLDADLNFINAVRVRTQRPETPSFFARIFGIDKFFLNANAVAYIGFAGSVPPFTVDQPIALCEQFLKVDDHYSCNVGRMISENDETGGWTNFVQPQEIGDNCGQTNPGSLNPLLCAGNPTELVFNKLIGTNNGMIETVFDNFKDDCWNKDEDPRTTPLNATLPVVDCLSGDLSQPCEEKVIAVVNVDIIWVQRKEKDPAPRKMQNGEDSYWECDAGWTDAQCWSDFVTEFGLKDSNGDPAELTKNAIYFLPNCDVHKPVGTSGGQNFGILAEIPVLVK
jgi:hypothetical protein